MVRASRWSAPAGSASTRRTHPPEWRATIARHLTSFNQMFNGGWYCVPLAARAGKSVQIAVKMYVSPSARQSGSVRRQHCSTSVRGQSIDNVLDDQREVISRLAHHLQCRGPSRRPTGSIPVMRSRRRSRAGAQAVAHAPPRRSRGRHHTVSVGDESPAVGLNAAACSAGGTGSIPQCATRYRQR
jgi:hypothetical protein